MNITSYFLAFFMVAVLSTACSKKTSPATSSKTETSKVEKKPAVAKVKTPTPKVIVVNDAAAKKAADGRYYYDLNGKRYWRNNKDGKYYLFNKSMYNSDDFKPLPTN